MILDMLALSAAHPLWDAKAVPFGDHPKDALARRGGL